MKLLLAKKAIELTKRSRTVSIEQQMIVQRQLLALISYVGFDYAEKKLNQVNFYPDKPTC